MPGEKRRQTLIEHREEAERSKKLATIERDLPLDVDLAKALADPPDRATMGELFRRFEFRGLLRRIDELEAAVPGAVMEREEHAVGAQRGGADALRALLAREGPIGRRGRRRRAARRRARRAGAADRGGRGDAGAGRRARARSSRTASSSSAARSAPPASCPAFDTELAAYLIDPGRSEYDLDDLLAEQGFAVAAGDGEGDAVLARRAAGHAAPARAARGAHRRARARPADATTWSCR